VYVKDQAAGSAFVTDLFGLEPATRFGPFHVVEVDNGVSLDYIITDHEFKTQHYAFLVGDDDQRRAPDLLRGHCCIKLSSANSGRRQWRQWASTVAAAQD
jgi:hypothetical protein